MAPQLFLDSDDLTLTKCSNDQTLPTEEEIDEGTVPSATQMKMSPHGAGLNDDVNIPDYRQNLVDESCFWLPLTSLMSSLRYLHRVSEVLMSCFGELNGWSVGNLGCDSIVANSSAACGIPCGLTHSCFCFLFLFHLLPYMHVKCTAPWPLACPRAWVMGDELRYTRGLTARPCGGVTQYRCSVELWVVITADDVEHTEVLPEGGSLRHFYVNILMARHLESPRGRYKNKAMIQPDMSISMGRASQVETLLAPYNLIPE